MTSALINLPRTPVLFGKLMLFTAPMFLLIASLALYVVYSERFIIERDKFSARIGNSVGRTASALEQVLATDQHDDRTKAVAAQQMLLLLLGDQSIKCATLSRSASEAPQLVAPAGLGCQFQEVDEWLAVNLASSDWSVLRVGFSKDELTVIRQSQLRYSLIVLLGSLIASLLSSWIAFHWIVGKPLKNLIKDLVLARDAADRASQAKTRFLANMSHEIRTPMNGIIGTAEFLVDSQLDDRQRDSVRTISESANALMTIIEDILDFAQLEGTHLKLKEQEFELGELIYGAVRLVELDAAGKGIDLIVDYADDEQHAFVGDNGRLRQILLNLLNNAVKFTLEGSVALYVNVVPREGWSDLICRVVDTGIGIPNDKLSTIFKPFGQATEEMTRQFGGTGLGLTISAELVALMGGTLTARSVLGKGSEFDVTIPLRHGRKIDPPAAVTALNALTRARDFKALVIVDLGNNLDALSVCLHRWNITCDKLFDPEQAVDQMMCAERQGAGYDLVVLDFDMSKTSSIDLATLIRNEDTIAGTPLVLLSRATIVTHQYHGFKGLFDAVLTKPVQPLALAQQLHLLLDGQAKPKGEPSEEKTVDADPIFASTDFLVVDDNEINRKVLALQLEPTGASVRFACNGSEAVESILERPADVILMDLSMPVMSGFEATSEIRSIESRQNRTPCLIFAISGNVLSEHKAFAQKVGMDGFIAKPTRREDLISTIAPKLQVSVHPCSANISETAPKATSPLETASELVEEALLDEKAVSYLREALDPGEFSDLTAVLIANGDEALADISTFFDDGNMTAVSTAAHKLAGSAASFGCIAIARAMSTLELDIKADEVISKDRVSNISLAWINTKTALFAMLQQVEN
jgi:signal transduction histidine kinase/DNA-binding response OmpR family regulator/HPt (histidine-containing phosphotransfer) domain-containing protein